MYYFQSHASCHWGQFVVHCLTSVWERLVYRKYSINWFNQWSILCKYAQGLTFWEKNPSALCPFIPNRSLGDLHDCRQSPSVNTCPRSNVIFSEMQFRPHLNSLLCQIPILLYCCFPCSHSCLDFPPPLSHTLIPYFPQTPFAWWYQSMVLLVFLLGGSNRIHWWIECVAWPTAFEKQFNASAFMCRWNKMDAGKTCSSSCPNRFSSPLTSALKKIEVWLFGTVMTCTACCFWNINPISTTVLFKWCIIWILTEIWTHSSTWTLHRYSLWSHALLPFPAWWGKLCFLHQFEVQIDVEWSRMVPFFFCSRIHRPAETQNEGAFWGGTAQPCSCWCFEWLGQ